MPQVLHRPDRQLDPRARPPSCRRRHWIRNPDRQRRPWPRTDAPWRRRSKPFRMKSIMSLSRPWLAPRNLANLLSATTASIFKHRCCRNGSGGPNPWREIIRRRQPKSDSSDFGQHMTGRTWVNPSSGAHAGAHILEAVGILGAEGDVFLPSARAAQPTATAGGG